MYKCQRTAHSWIYILMYFTYTSIFGGRLTKYKAIVMTRIIPTNLQIVREFSLNVCPFFSHYRIGNVLVIKFWNKILSGHYIKSALCTARTYSAGYVHSFAECDQVGGYYRDKFTIDSLCDNGAPNERGALRIGLAILHRSFIGPRQRWERGFRHIRRNNNNGVRFIAFFSCTTMPGADIIPAIHIDGGRRRRCGVRTARLSSLCRTSNIRVLGNTLPVSDLRQWLTSKILLSITRERTKGASPAVADGPTSIEGNFNKRAFAIRVGDNIVRSGRKMCAHAPSPLQISRILPRHATISRKVAEK